MTVTAVRFVFFLIVMAVLVGWVSAGNSEFASSVRFFLRQLLRQMF